MQVQSNEKQTDLARYSPMNSKDRGIETCAQRVGRTTSSLSSISTFLTFPVSPSVLIVVLLHAMRAGNASRCLSSFLAQSPDFSPTSPTQTSHTCSTAVCTPFSRRSRSLNEVCFKARADATREHGADGAGGRTLGQHHHEPARTSTTFVRGILGRTAYRHLCEGLPWSVVLVGVRRSSRRRGGRWQPSDFRTRANCVE